MPASVRLTDDELDTALMFIEKKGASDFYPQPFEFKALRSSWPKARQTLSGIELLNYSPHSALEMIAPKQKCLVRPVHLLDPIDTILYTALCFRLAAGIQAQRTYQDNIVFSCHFNADPGTPPDSRFTSDWDRFSKTVTEKVGTSPFVGTADIVDFFSRIYLHRFKNAIEHATNDEYATRALMRLVEGWSHGTSYGIPIGPLASNFLAEALLIEVDQYLLSRNVDFLRWVDDYVLFGGSTSEVQEGLFQLGTRLHMTQGLSLNPYKTRIRTGPQYAADVLRHEPTQELYERIIDVIFLGNPYTQIDFDELDDEQRSFLEEIDVEELVSDAVQGDFINVRALRVILKVLSAFRRPDLIDPIVDNLERLLPASESVGRFFGALDASDGPHEEIGGRLLNHVTEGGFSPDFQILWLLHPFTMSEKWNHLLQLRLLASEAQHSFVRRQAILALGMSGDRSALLDLKSAVDQASDWEQRAIVFACRALPRDERQAFVRQMGGTRGQWDRHNVLSKAVLKLIEAV